MIIRSHCQEGLCSGQRDLWFPEKVLLQWHDAALRSKKSRAHTKHVPHEGYVAKYYEIARWYSFLIPLIHRREEHFRSLMKAHLGMDSNLSSQGIAYRGSCHPGLLCMQHAVPQTSWLATIFVKMSLIMAMILKESIPGLDGPRLIALVSCLAANTTVRLHAYRLLENQRTDFHWMTTMLQVLWQWLLSVGVIY